MKEILVGIMNHRGKSGRNHEYQDSNDSASTLDSDHTVNCRYCGSLGTAQLVSVIARVGNNGVTSARKNFLILEELHLFILYIVSTTNCSVVIFRI